MLLLSDKKGNYQTDFSRTTSNVLDVNSPYLNTKCHFDSQGKLIKKFEQSKFGNTSYSYNFDEKGHLTKVYKDNEEVETYTYDEDGHRELDNILHKGKERRFIYAGDQLAYTTEENFNYKNGVICARNIETYDSNLAYKNQERFYYDEYLRPIIYSKNDGTLVNYNYDDSFMVSSKEVNYKLAERFYWDNLLLTRYEDVQNHYAFEFSYGEDRKLTGVRLIENDKVINLRLGLDHLGSPRYIVHENGQLFKKIVYDSFGNVIEESAENYFFPIGFAGGLRDKHTKFVRFIARDYYPNIGRFTAPDPANDTRGDGDVYDYCVDDPVSMADYMGLAWNETNHNRYKYGKIETDGSMLEAIGMMKLAPSLGVAKIADKIEEFRGKEPRHYNNVMEKVAKPHAQMLGKVAVGQMAAPAIATSAPAVVNGASAVAHGAKNAVNMASGVYNNVGMQVASKFPQVTKNMTDFVAGFGSGVPSIPPASAAGIVGAGASFAEPISNFFKNAINQVKKR